MASSPMESSPIRPFNAQLADNPLRTRADLQRAVEQILDPVMRLCLASGRYGRLHLSNSAALYDDDRAQIEGFCRLLWGLGPLMTDSTERARHPQWWAYVTDSFVHCTNPDDPDYWGGGLTDYDQIFVEMGAIAAFLYESKTTFWDQLSASDQQHILDWLEQVNHRQLPKTNWLFFRILVNNWFVDTGHPDHAKLIDADWQIVSHHYLGRGWSYDGYVNQIDNYIPGAYHFFSLLRAGFEDAFPDRSDTIRQQCAVIRDHAAAFFPDYAGWFASDGACVPFGRSLDYRFFQSGFWAASAFAHVTPPRGWSLGMVKHLLLANLRWWFAQPMFQADGTLLVGYCYPNMNMAEGYNGPASAYWALTTMIILALPASDPFWSHTVEESVPDRLLGVDPLTHLHTEPQPRMLVARSKTGKEVQVFTAGQHSHEHALGDAKYEKFVYSTSFAFSVPKSRILLKQGAFDSTLALSQNADSLWWKVPFGFAKWAIHDRYTYSLWNPWENVSVQSFIIPCMPWHVRVHVIDTDRVLHCAEGGFSLPTPYPLTDGSDGGTEAHPKAVLNDVSASSVSSVSSVFYRDPVLHAITGLVASPGFTAEMTMPEPNTNVRWARQTIPLQQGTLQPGHHVLVSLYLGDREAESVRPDGLIDVPTVRLQGSHLTLSWKGHQSGITLEEIEHK
jgi:hypothetical protein